LDAVTLDVINPLIAAGRLPNLADVFASGSRGILRSTTHPLTPQAWTTMFTGVNAGRHGIWDFTAVGRSDYRVRMVNGSARRAAAFWDLLSAEGRSVGLLNVPYTWPAPAVRGFSVAGFDAAGVEDRMAFPAPLVSEIRKRFRWFQLDHTFPLDGHGRRLDLDRVRRACEHKVELALWLTERYEPELLFVVFMSADHIHHLAWPDWEQSGAESVVARVYELLDEAVGALRRGLGSDGDLLIVSDHGGGSLRGVVNLNAWLAQEGYLAFRPAASTRTHVVTGLPLRLAALRRRVPERFRYRLKQHLPAVGRTLRAMRPEAAIDWEASRAFAYGTFGNIVINVRGRQPRGVVAPGEEYERVRAEIEARALALRGPQGEDVVVAVHRREDLFEGPELERIPDLIVEFDDYAWLGKGAFGRPSAGIWDSIRIPHSTLPYVGSHRYEGLVALTGPSAARFDNVSAGILDVAPTILYLLDHEVPPELEGRVLLEVIEPALRESRPPDYGGRMPSPAPSEEYDARSAAEVENRLRALGYLE
jgi:predicted AlkP superfamily phosphohydrolase/phosphomutase